MTRELVFLICLAACAVVGLAWWAYLRYRGAVVAALLWISAPVRSDTHRKLSLARLAAAGFIGALLWLLFRHPSIFTQMQWPASVLLLGVFLVLFADVIGGKPFATKIIETLTQRFGGGGMLEKHTETTVTATGDAAVVAVGEAEVPLPEEGAG